MISRDTAWPPVWLIGAGPGAADLLTIRAARLLGEADIVFHDTLIGPDILDLIPGRRVSVGKRAGAHSKQQPVINRMLVDAARSGARVARLKGGDPSIFGRSAEEIAALAAAGLTARICPGVTTACAAAAEAGLSLTLREQARAVTFVTAQSCASRALELDWAALAAPRSSLVAYMARAAAPHIARRLIEAGRDGATPVLIAADVSLPSARLVHARLDTLAVTMLALPAGAPTTLLIGEAFAAVPAPAAREVSLA